MIFNCPSCRAPIAELGGPGSVVLMCDRCRYRYRVISGGLLSSATKPAMLRRGILQYEVELDTGDGARFAAAFEFETRHAVSLAVGNTISVAYALRGDERRALLTVINHTSGVTYEIERVDDGANLAAPAVGIVVGIVAFSAMASVPYAAAFFAPLAGIGSFFGMRRVLRPTVQLAPGVEQQLMQVRPLLERKQDLETELVRVERERRNKLALRERIEQLRAKMNALDPKLYEIRSNQLGAAIATLDQQIALDEQLIEGYQRSAAMLEIEIEASAQASSLPDDIAEVLRLKQEQLAAIEAQNAELERMLSANQEVERLLKGP